MISVDISDLERTINSINGDDLRRMERAALRSGAKILYDDTKRRFSSALPAAVTGAQHVGYGIRKQLYRDRLIDAVRMNTDIDELEHNAFFTVDILGSRKKGSGTFRARFFEGGTIERHDKRTGASKGAIKGLAFFDDAITNNESKIFDTIETSFINELDKKLK